MPFNEPIEETIQRMAEEAQKNPRPDMQIPMPCNLLEIKIGKNYHNLSLHESSAVAEDDWDDTKGEWLDA